MASDLHAVTESWLDPDGRVMQRLDCGHVKALRAIMLDGARLVLPTERPCAGCEDDAARGRGAR